MSFIFLGHFPQHPLTFIHIGEFRRPNLDQAHYWLLDIGYNDFTKGTYG